MKDPSSCATQFNGAGSLHPKGRTRQTFGGCILVELPTGVGANIWGNRARHRLSLNLSFQQMPKERNHGIAASGKDGGKSRRKLQRQVSRGLSQLHRRVSRKPESYWKASVNNLVPTLGMLRSYQSEQSPVSCLV